MVAAQEAQAQAILQQARVSGEGGLGVGRGPGAKGRRWEELEGEAGVNAGQGEVWGVWGLRGNLGSIKD